MKQSELIFEIHEAEEGGYWARALGEDIFTQAENWDELKKSVCESVECHYDNEEDRPGIIRLHFIRDEVIAL